MNWRVRMLPGLLVALNLDREVSVTLGRVLLYGVPARFTDSEYRQAHLNRDRFEIRSFGERPA